MAEHRFGVEAGPRGFRFSRAFPFQAPGKALREKRPSAAASFATHHLTLSFLSAVALCGAWEWAGLVPISPAFPTFSETMAALWSISADGSLAGAFAVTLQPLALGLVISMVLGVGLGVAMGLSPKTEWLASPIFIVAQSAPLAALIPLIVFAYGIGLTSKTIVVCIMAMPVIVLNSFAAVRHTPKSLIEMGESFLATRSKVITRIILPAASPVIFAGLRLGCASGFIGAVLGELLITPTGVGDLITYSRSIADYPTMYAAILSIMAFCVLFIEVLGRIEVTIFRPEKRASS
ncbi:MULTISPECIES: ABC transporter permease [unclassified Sinorhizobium]|uniref:ABC transporter permease n=1 Tax=unclassified Sinorhizobium TaxID=2613772 RepID=UPI0024C34723|nr:MULTISPECIES: ABC transporter permease [unclassified Sinorhizobium]MDK1374510.1 ABC transporter permease [Sinorhizobium sp. 6-70]MDK1479160.1 ABC transporter permease [Sinorhizobium sp. 6-117]